MKNSVRKELDILLSNYPELSPCKDDIRGTFAILLDCYRRGRKIMTCGNGGSSTDASHIVGELMKEFKQKRPVTKEDRQILKSLFPEKGDYLADHLQQAIPAISLTDSFALTSAFINDANPDMVFAQQVFGYGKADDVLIAISTSGKSPNIINACEVAKAFGIKTIGMTGLSGGAIKNICDITIRVPADETYRVQEYHLPVYHTLCAMLEIHNYL